MSNLLLAEPLNMVRCGSPVTSLHRVLPTVSLGYAILDLVDGFAIDLAFMMHGIAFFTFSLCLSEINKNELLAIMLTLEVSNLKIILLFCFFQSKAILITDCVFLTLLRFSSPRYFSTSPVRTF